MDELDDLPLDPTPPPDVVPAEKPLWPWIVGFLLVTGALGTLVYLRSRPPQGATTPAPSVTIGQATTSTAAVRSPLGPVVEPVDLPPLDASDGVVRELVKAISARPEVMAWLATDGLIRNVAVCIDNVADGKTPARHLKAVAPAGTFGATGTDDRWVTMPASFARYDGIASALGGLDMNATARLYSTLKPRLEEAYQQLGHKPGDLDIDVEAAIVQLLSTPDVPTDAALTRAVLSYRYADGELETLSGAQKQLLRMGPRNAQTVKAKLRELATALGLAPSAGTAPVR